MAYTSLCLVVISASGSTIIQLVLGIMLLFLSKKTSLYFLYFHILGKVFSLLMAGVMFTGSYYVAQANNMIGKITGSNYKVDKMVVAVRADDSAETIEDAADYTYGVQFEKGADNIQTAVADIEKQVGVDTIEVKEYDSVQDQAQALIDGDCDAIIYNSAYTSLMEETVDGYS